MASETRFSIDELHVDKNPYWKHKIRFLLKAEKLDCRTRLFKYQQQLHLALPVWLVVDIELVDCEASAKAMVRSLIFQYTMLGSTKAKTKESTSAVRSKGILRQIASRNRGTEWLWTAERQFVQ